MARFLQTTFLVSLIVSTVSVCAQSGTVIHSFAPEEQTSPQRDPGAIAIVEKALAAMGGRDAIDQVADCVANGHSETFQGSGLVDGKFVWKNAGNEFRYENSGASGTHVLVSGHGNAIQIRAGASKPVHGHVTLALFPLHLPGVVLLHELADVRYTIKLVQNATDDPQIAHVHTSRNTNAVTAAVTPQEWFFDVHTGLPIRVEYRLPEETDATRTSPASVGFRDYRPEHGMMLPHLLDSFVDGQTQATAHITSFSFDTGLDATEFEAPKGGVR